jgi:hypothetical protein
MRSSVPSRWALALVCLPGFLGCEGTEIASEPAVPIEDIPDDKRLGDLDDAEQRGVCAWASSVATERLPEPGTVIDCVETDIQINAPICDFPDNGLPGCEATLADYKICIPALMSRIATNPCALLEIISDEQAREFVETTPGCEGLGPCTRAL